MKQPGNNHFLLSDIDLDLCTHLTYATVGMNSKTWTLRPSSEELDVINGTYKHFNDLKMRNPNLKTMICTSGAGHTEHSGFTRLVADPEKRKTFTESVVDLLNKYDFDGFDIDWEYPGPLQKDDFMMLLKEMREAFDNNQGKRLLLSAAVGHNPATVDGVYDAKMLSDTLDFINVMTYDYHGYSPRRPWTHLNSPLYYLPSDESIAQNSAYAMEYWAKAGADPHKLLMGIPAYGRGYILADPNEFGIHAPAVGNMPPPLNISNPRHHGYWAYNEYCDKMRTESKQWTEYRNSRTVAPYFVNGLNWLGIDDAFSAMVKAAYVRDMGFGGVMLWTINQDDFRGFCGEKFGMTKAMARIFDLI